MLPLLMTMTYLQLAELLRTAFSFLLCLKIEKETLCNNKRFSWWTRRKENSRERQGGRKKNCSSWKLWFPRNSWLALVHAIACLLPPSNPWLASLVLWWLDLLFTAIRWWGSPSCWNEATEGISGLVHHSAMAGPLSTTKGTERKVQFHKKRMI